MLFKLLKQVRTRLLIRTRLRRLWHNHIYGRICHFWGELPRTGERIDPRNDSVVEVAHKAIYYFGQRWIQENDRVLDIGCGAGYGSDIFREIHNIEYLGLDYSPAAIQFAKNNFANDHIRFQRMNMDLLRKNPNHLGYSRHFDFVFASNSMEHFCEAQELLGAISALITQSGVFLMAVPPIPMDGQSDGNPFHLTHLTAVTWSKLLLNHFKKVDTYSHLTKELPAKEQIFQLSPADQLLPENTASSILVAQYPIDPS